MDCRLKLVRLRNASHVLHLQMAREALDSVPRILSKVLLTDLENVRHESVP